MNLNPDHSLLRRLLVAGCVFLAVGAATAAERLFVATALTAEGSFTAGIEGPACDKAGNIYAVNFARKGSIGRIAPDGRAEIFAVLPGPSVGNAIRIALDGTLVVADYVGHRLFRINPRTCQVAEFAHEAGMNQPNDLALAADGTVYASDPDWKGGTGRVWRFGREGRGRVLAAGLGTVNGIEVSPDGCALYVNETIQRGVWMFPIAASGALGPRRRLKQFDAFGLDGMRCDIDGDIYVTRPGAGTVVELTPSGELRREIAVLGPRPTNICFGGPDGRTAYVTEAGRRRIVQFRTDRPGLEWQRWHQK